MESNLYNITSRKQKAQEIAFESRDDSNCLDKHAQLLTRRGKGGIYPRIKFLWTSLFLKSLERSSHRRSSRRLRELREEQRWIENLELLLKDKELKEKRIKELDEGVDACEEEMMGLYKVNGSLEEKLATLEESRETLQKEEELQHTITAMYAPHGISSDIVRKTPSH